MLAYESFLFVLSLKWHNGPVENKVMLRGWLSPYLTVMRRILDGFANRFANPSTTVAKRSHGIVKSSHASRTRHERFPKVLYNVM